MNSTSPQNQSIEQGAVAQVASASQKCHGWAKGCQGYSAADCTASVTAIKEILLLGSHQWVVVLKQYNDYAKLNNQAIQEMDPLKIKFWALVNHSKPTGNPDCQRYVCEAKSTQTGL